MSKDSNKNVKPPCPYYGKCGGCQLQNLSNKDQNLYKQKEAEKLLGKYGRVENILVMDDPYNYRNKIQYSFGYDKKGKIISGMYESNTHKIIDIDKCLIQDPIADEIIKTIKSIMKKYKMEPYNEDTRQGFLRHVLIKTGHKTGEVMVVVVTANHMFHGKKNFVKILRKKHPQISTVIQNINSKNTSMILGDRESNMYGKGYIEDILCGLRFRISSKSFYQINPSQTETLYNKAIEMAGFKGNERIIDAYCGIGTISLIVANKVKEVIGVELNGDAIQDAIRNSKINNINNVKFYKADAGEFMVGLASKNEKIDAVIMDPPRAGSDEAFLHSMCQLNPEKIVYISCNMETQARDLEYLVKNGYKVKGIQPVDMFPQTGHVETVCLMSKVEG